MRSSLHFLPKFISPLIPEKEKPLPDYIAVCSGPVTFADFNIASERKKDYDCFGKKKQPAVEKNAEIPLDFDTASSIMICMKGEMISSAEKME